MVKTKQPARTRAVADGASDVGELRHDLYRAGSKRIDEAIAAGWYLEAITLTESLIADRLESRLGFLEGKDRGFQNLGPLIKGIQKAEIDAELRHLVEQDLDDWRDARNEAVHEILKIAVGQRDTWEARMARLRDVALEGKRVLRAVNARVSKLRRGSTKRHGKHRGTSAGLLGIAP